MKEKLVSFLGALGIVTLLFFGSKIAKRAYDRDITPEAKYDQGDCIKLAYREHGQHAMIDKVNKKNYIIKFYKEIPRWQYDFDGERYYDPFYQVTKTKVYTLREGNHFFESVGCPHMVFENE